MILLPCNGTFAFDHFHLRCTKKKTLYKKPTLLWKKKIYTNALAVAVLHQKSFPALLYVFPPQYSALQGNRWMKYI